MANPHCQCPIAGFCHRHKMVKTDHEFGMCKGIAPTIDCGRKYWVAWEQGMIGATRPENPIVDPEPFCIKSRGLGDAVSTGLQFMTGGLLTPCGGCKDRGAVLNHWIPAPVPSIETIDLTSPTRHFMCHIYPVAGYGAWQWNCDQILANAHLFNGRRIVSIVTDGSTDCADAVREYLKDFTDDFIVQQNDSNLREVSTFIPMLEKLEAYQGENDVTFTCHAKAVKHKIAVDDPSSTIFRWARAMYETVLNWGAVQPLLEKHGTVGSFRRFAAAQRGGWGPWHFSGTFYWFRNRDAFRRNWRYLPQRFFGTEAWPGILFKSDEAGCVFADNVDDLYNLNYWQTQVEPQLAAWRESCKS